MRAAHRAQSRFIASGVTATGAEKLRPESLDFTTTTLSAVGAHEPQRPVGFEGRCGGEGRILGFAVVLRGSRAAHKEESKTEEKLTHRARPYC